MDDSVAPVVAGYRLGAVLGRGASAVVWSGRRVADGRSVAVKVVPLPADGGDLAVRELGLLRGLGGDHVVALLDAVPVNDPGEALALVMDRYDGGSLARVVAARGRLTPGEIVTALSPVAAALGGLHRAGVVHGDLTPGNVLFDGSGRPAICDLGVTRVVGERTDAVFGTKGFVAPEVTVGEQPTPASDVYAVGALAWFCATGEAPEPGWLRQVPSAETLAGLPVALVAVIEACLVAEPGERPSAVDLSVALFECASAQPLQLPGTADDVDSLTRRIRAGALEPVQPGGSTATEPEGSRWPRWWRRRPRVGRRQSSVGHLSRAAGTVGTAAAAPVADAAPAADPEPAHRARHAAPPDARSARGRRPVLSGVVTTILALVFLTVGALVAVAAGWEPRDVLPRHASTMTPASGRPAPSTSPRSPARPSARAPTSAEPTAVDLASAGALATAPTAVLQGLADARAALWTSGDIARLGTVDAAGSAAWADDAQRIGEATTGGWRYRNVRFTVRSAAVLRHTATTATLRVVLDSAAYDVVGPLGPQHRAATSGQQLVIDLMSTAAGWRVSRVQP